MNKHLLTGTAAILLAAAIVTMGCQSDPIDSLGQETAITTQTKENPIPQVRSKVPRITAKELKSRLDSGEDILIIDTRTRSFYDSSHIAGSIQILGPEIAEHLDELPRDVDIVLYCT